MAINSVVLVGRMTKDAELRYTPSNVAVATFTLAVNRSFKNQNGEREADFINVFMWRQQAENLASWAKKGTLVGIEGRIQTRSYDNQQGQRVYQFVKVKDKGKVDILHQATKRQRNLHLTFQNKKILSDEQIHWIFQMMIYHSN